MKCFACGVQIRQEARFCPYCGKNQSERPAEQLCPQCGQPLTPGAGFCDSCGCDVSKQPEVPPVEELLETELVAEPEAEAEEAPAVAEESAAEEANLADEETPQELAEEEIPAEVEPEPEPVAAAPEEEPQPEPVPYQHTPEPVPAQIIEDPKQPPVVQPVYYPAPPVRPAFQLPNGRGMWKMILLSLVTFGIYPLVIWCKISMEINVVASRYDGKWTMHYLCMMLLAPLTLMIYPFVWIHELCNRIGDELIRRKINYKFSAATFWLWNLLYPLLGAVVTVLLFFLLPNAGLSELVVNLSSAAAGVISFVGPLVYLHKNMKAMNLLNTDYNERG